jgi:hypothetical protein
MGMRSVTGLLSVKDVAVLLGPKVAVLQGSLRNWAERTRPWPSSRIDGVEDQRAMCDPISDERRRQDLSQSSQR